MSLHSPQPSPPKSLVRTGPGHPLSQAPGAYPVLDPTVSCLSTSCFCKGTFTGHRDRARTPRWVALLRPLQANPRLPRPLARGSRPTCNRVAASTLPRQPLLSTLCPRHGLTSAQTPPPRLFPPTESYCRPRPVLLETASSPHTSLVLYFYFHDKCSEPSCWVLSDRPHDSRVPCVWNQRHT